MAKSKYGAVKTTIDGILFDSKLEGYFYGLLKQFRLTAYITLQEVITLQDGYTCSNGDVIRAITTRIDYVFRRNGLCVYIDTKGIVTPEFKIKWKILRYLNRKHTGRDYFLPNSQAKCREVIDYLLKL